MPRQKRARAKQPPGLPCDGDEVLSPMVQGKQLSEERSCAEALMMACDERLGAQSPASLLACDKSLSREFWAHFVSENSHLSSLFSWGCNGGGQLGTGDTETRTSPTDVEALHCRRIHDVACGAQHVVVAEENGTLWAWGLNNCGELGQGDALPRLCPIEIAQGHCIRAVACGGFHTVILDGTGSLWATGFNLCGQLGLGDRNFRFSFTRVSGFGGQPVVSVACGYYFTFALTKNGEWFSWGSNSHGELGTGDAVPRTKPSPVPALNSIHPLRIACGSEHSIALLETGELVAWGNNNHGQLGLGDTADRLAPGHFPAFAGKRVTVFSCGHFHSAAILETGELLTWGWNERGQLGLGDCEETSKPKRVEEFRNRPVKSIACGCHHTLALLESGEVFSFGHHESGQLACSSSSSCPSTPQQVHFFDGKSVKTIHMGLLFAAAVIDVGK